MVIALDIDDTITRHPEFFAVLSDALVRSGHRVIIITLRWERTSTEQDLAEWGIQYDALYMASDDEFDITGFDEWKAQVCEQEGVDVFFEDSPEILRHVDSKVLCLMAVDNGIHDLDSLCGH